MIPDAIRRYVDEHTAPVRPLPIGSLLERLRQETKALPNGGMIFSRDSAALVSVLVKAIGARRAIEVGTFTGYSALTVALALPADGKLVACDVSEEWTAIARRWWREAGVEARIELRLAPAVHTLDELLRAGGSGSFDFALIDADKESYLHYYERCLELLRRDGLMAIDNTLWGGRVADDTVQDAETVAIRALDRRVRDDARVEACLLTIGDGLTVVRKR